MNLDNNYLNYEILIEVLKQDEDMDDSVKLDILETHLSEINDQIYSIEYTLIIKSNINQIKNKLNPPIQEDEEFQSFPQSQPNDYDEIMSANQSQISESFLSYNKFSSLQGQENINVINFLKPISNNENKIEDKSNRWKSEAHYVKSDQTTLQKSEKRFNDVKTNLEDRITNLENQMNLNNNDKINIELNSISTIVQSLSKCEFKYESNKTKFKQIQLILIQQVQFLTLSQICQYLTYENEQANRCNYDLQCPEFQQCRFSKEDQNYSSSVDVYNEIIDSMQQRGYMYANKQEQFKHLPKDLTNFLLSGRCIPYEWNQYYFDSCKTQLEYGITNKFSECSVVVSLYEFLKPIKDEFLSFGMVSVLYRSRDNIIDMFILSVAPLVLIALIIVLQIINFIMNIRKIQMINSLTKDSRKLINIMYPIAIQTLLVIFISKIKNLYSDDVDLFRDSDSLFFFTLSILTIVPILALISLFVLQVQSTQEYQKYLEDTQIVQVDDLVSNVIYFQSIFYGLILVRVIIQVLFEMMNINWKITDIFFNVFGLLVLFDLDSMLGNQIIHSSFTDRVTEAINDKINIIHDNESSFRQSSYMVQDIDEYQETLKNQCKSYRILFFLTVIQSIFIQNVIIYDSWVINFMWMFQGEPLQIFSAFIYQFFIQGTDILTKNFRNDLKTISRKSSTGLIKLILSQLAKEIYKFVILQLNCYFAQGAINQVADKIMNVSDQYSNEQ